MSEIMQKMKDKVEFEKLRFRMHWSRQKYAYVYATCFVTATTVAVAALALNKRNLKEFNAFLEEKGIDPAEFFLTHADYAEYLEDVKS